MQMCTGDGRTGVQRAKSWGGGNLLVDTQRERGQRGPDDCAGAERVPKLRPPSMGTHGLRLPPPPAPAHLGDGTLSSGAFKREKVWGFALGT